MEKSPFVEASFYLLLRIDRSFVAENGQNGHISKVLRLNQCGERGEGVYKLRRLAHEMTINDHYTYLLHTCRVWHTRAGEFADVGRRNDKPRTLAGL